MTIMPKNVILEPPDELDGAEVVLWAYNPEKPFFIMKCSDGREYKPIHGFPSAGIKGLKHATSSHAI